MPNYSVFPTSPALVLVLLFSAALVFSLLIRFWLATRQMRHVAIHSDAVPAAFAGTVSLEAHRKAARYTLTKGSFGLWTMAFSAIVPAKAGKIGRAHV